MFERYGDIGDVHIPRDRHSRQSRGFGFVRFVSRKDADYAVSRMDGRYVDGREIRVSFAKYDRPIDEHGYDRNHSDRGSGRGERDRRRFVFFTIIKTINFLRSCLTNTLYILFRVPFI